MKNIWKWILGILVVLLVVAALVTIPFAMHTYMAGQAPRLAQAQPPAVQNGNPQAPGPDGLFDRGQGRFNNRGGPMMGGFNQRSAFGRRFGGFGIGMMFLGGLLRLLPWAVLGALLFGAYQFGKRAGLRTAQVGTPSPAPLPAAHVAAETQQDETPPPAA